MGMHDGYLDRMATRIEAFERELRAAADQGMDAVRRRDLEAGLASVKERLQTLRRSGAGADRRDDPELHPGLRAPAGVFRRWRATGGVIGALTSR